MSLCLFLWKGHQLQTQCTAFKHCIAYLKNRHDGRITDKLLPLFAPLSGGQIQSCLTLVNIQHTVTSHVVFFYTNSRSSMMNVVGKSPVNSVQLLIIKWTTTAVLSMFWSSACPKEFMSFSRWFHRKLKTSAVLGWIMSPTPYNKKTQQYCYYNGFFSILVLCQIWCRFSWSLTLWFLVAPWSMARCVNSRRMQDWA